MSTLDDLPEGVTFNNNSSKEIELELVEESINETICNECNLHFKAILITNGSRHNGLIKTMGDNEHVIWENSLPKDRVRSIKLLNENLLTKLDKHKERHND